MLITDKFVMLNFPKTGTAFARDALKHLHRPGGLRSRLEAIRVLRPALQELLMKPFFFTQEHAGSIDRDRSEHGVFIQVPEQHRHKPVVTVVRDPLERLVSLFEFRSWAKYPMPDREQATTWFPQFPDLSFSEFFQLNQVLALPNIQPTGMQVEVGPLTTQFIRFYARDPRKTILSLREDTDLRKDYDLHFPKIRFIHTENLNRELHSLLLEFGYPKKKIAFILEKEKMNTSKRTRATYLTPELIAQLHHSERFFYQLFPEYLHPAD
ncbi:MAG: hypothetical protein IT230_14815 [Flavobacteriales bacterium]|nr:hypothetical protein [Flavobacteriales bacterium]